MLTIYQDKKSGKWGVEDRGSVLYEPEFCKRTAKAIADMENSNDVPIDWEETAARLVKMGLPLD